MFRDLALFAGIDGPPGPPILNYNKTEVDVL